MKNYLYLLVFLIFSTICFSQNQEAIFARTNYLQYYQPTPSGTAEKVMGVKQYREFFSKTPYRLSSMKISLKSWEKSLEQLNDEGQFKDLMKTEENLRANNLFDKSFGSTENEVALFFSEAYNRLWSIAEAYRKSKVDENTMYSPKVLKAIVYYGNIEINRSNAAGRFHYSCFAMPTAAVNIYFAMLKKMDEVESGKVKDPMLVDAADMLKMIALQAWTQPLRNDETDKNIVQLNRFRNHVWWVGGNALGYRSLLPVAFMYKSIPMIDLLAEVSQKCISTTSQNTYESSFWTEGFTADGAGWGHGMQCLVWGYPIDGTSNALELLNVLNKSPWAQQLSKENTNALMNFFRGSNWYYYKGYILPGLDRYSMRYEPEPKAIRYQKMLETLLSDWKHSFTPEEQAELTQLNKEVDENNILMKKQVDGLYSGSRWFFNNDDLIKKNEQYSIFVNMASVRCDGLESAINIADEYNFFTADGMTLFQKSGDEYRPVFGAWDVTAAPGVTAREGMDNIKPITNWRGYCSKFNFAGAATAGGENAVAGFIFEKMNGSEKNGVNDPRAGGIENPSIYGVQAHKSYFMMGDYMVALGAGINNLKPEMEATIRTTIDQTAKVNEVFVLQNGKKITPKEGLNSFVDSFDKKGKPVWVVQKDKFAYTILPEYTKNAYFVSEHKKTDWLKMNSSNKKVNGLPEKVDILRLWIDHGQQVQNGTYGYVVYAGNGLPAKKLLFKVLQNDTLIQAIQSCDEKITEAVFYKSDIVLKAGKVKLSASAPCAVLLSTQGKKTTVSVNDPLMNPDLKQIELNINRKKVSVNLPQGELAGKPATITIAE